MDDRQVSQKLGSTHREGRSKQLRGKATDELIWRTNFLNSNVRIEAHIYESKQWSDNHCQTALVLVREPQVNLQEDMVDFCFRQEARTCKCHTHWAENLKKSTRLCSYCHGLQVLNSRGGHHTSVPPRSAIDTGVSSQPLGTLKEYRGISDHPTPWPPLLPSGLM